MEDYRDSLDDGNELETLDFDALVQNLEVLHYSEICVCETSVE